jgi:hypothetical protein
MKNIFLASIVLVLSTPALAAVTCKDFQDENTKVQVIKKKGNVLTKENWKTIDVILSFNYNDCAASTSQTLIKVKNELFWRFESTDDSCDGGNTYGSIYTEDLKTPIAHIYDSGIYCDDDWRAEERHENHVCDTRAEVYAQEKMREFGFDFENLSSALELREPYTYSFIRVSGTIKNKSNKEAIVNVLTNVKSCKMASAHIEHLEL